MDRRRRSEPPGTPARGSAGNRDPLCDAEGLTRFADAVAAAVALPLAADAWPVLGFGVLPGCLVFCRCVQSIAGFFGVLPGCSVSCQEVRSFAELFGVLTGCPSAACSQPAAVHQCEDAFEPAGNRVTELRRMPCTFLNHSFLHSLILPPPGPWCTQDGQYSAATSFRDGTQL